MKKRVFMLAVVLIVAMFAAMPVMADIGTEEQKIIDALNAAGVPAAEVTKATEWLDMVDVERAARDIGTQINAARVTAAGRPAADIPQDDRYAILANIEAAADIANGVLSDGEKLTVTVAGRTVTVSNPDGPIISAVAPARAGTPPPYTAPDAANPIKATGLAVDFSALAYTGIALSGLFGIAVVLGRKRKPASATAA